MKNALRFLITIVFIINFSNVYSQEDYQPGYIVLLNGDTLRGLVDIRGEVRNSRIVNFKETFYADKTTFYPAKIRTYHVNGKSFYSKKVAVKGGDKSVFMLLESGGKISFYSYRDPSNKTRFYIEKGSDFIELTNDLKNVVKKDPATGVDQTYITNSNKYYAILKYLFNDCGYYQQHELRVDFNANSIAKEVSRYNACFEDVPGVETKTKNKKGVFKKSVLIGVNFAHVTASARNQFFNPGDGITGLSIGFLGQVYPANFNKKIGLDFGVFYNKKGGISEQHQREFKLHYFDFYAGADFNYPKGKLQPSISGGIVYGILLNPGSAFTKINANGEKGNIFNDDDIANSEFGFLIALTFNYYSSEKNAISFRFSYESTQLIFQFVRLNFKNKMIGIRVGYLF